MHGIAQRSHWIRHLFSCVKCKNIMTEGNKRVKTQITHFFTRKSNILPQYQQFIHIITKNTMELTLKISIHLGVHKQIQNISLFSKSKQIGCIIIFDVGIRRNFVNDRFILLHFIFIRRNFVNNVLVLFHLIFM